MDAKLVKEEEIRQLLAGEDEFALSKAALDLLVSEGMPYAGEGLYDAIACLHWYIGHLRRSQLIDEIERRMAVAIDQASQEMRGKSPFQVRGIWEKHVTQAFAGLERGKRLEAHGMKNEHVSVEEIAVLLAGEGKPALSAMAISNFVKEGMPKAARGRYPERACALWYIARLRNAVHQRAVELPDGKVVTLDEAQRRLTIAKAENEEMTAKERRGELIPLHLYVSEVSKMVVLTKQKLLNLPARISSQLDGLTKSEQKALLTAAIKGALTELAKGPEDAANLPRTVSKRR